MCLVPYSFDGRSLGNHGHDNERSRVGSGVIMVSVGGVG